MIFLFSKNFWRVFGTRLLETLFRKSSFRYDFGFGRRDVKDVCKYHLQEPYAKELKKLAKDNSLQGKTDSGTMLNIMQWLLNNYNPRYYYTSDRGDRWNTPLETMQSFNEKKQRKTRSFSTDCDDYAILIYNLARVCKVPKEKLRLCFMKTKTEWHLNVMFLEDGVPYAVEGTYYPSIAIKNFMKTPYFNNYTTINGEKAYYYEGVRWLWNEDELFINNGKLNKV